MSLLCSERLENCVVFSSLKFLWIKVPAKWINVNVDIKNVKVWIWALKIWLISGRFSIRLLRIGSQPLLVDLVTTPFAFSFEGNSELAGDVFWRSHFLKATYTLQIFSCIVDVLQEPGCFWRLLKMWNILFAVRSLQHHTQDSHYEEFVSILASVTQHQDVILAIEWLVTWYFIAQKDWTWTKIQGCVFS